MFLLHLVDVALDCRQHLPADRAEAVVFS